MTAQANIVRSMDGQAMIEIERPRSATELIGATFEVYRRFPFLFLVFAAVVVVPYQLIVLAITGTGPATARSLTTVESMILTITATVLVGPLVSALHVHAVSDINEGRRPEIASVARRSLRTLPMVAVAVVISWLGILAGFVALIIPGILLSLRWSVTAQAAALEGGSWTKALKRSADLSRDNWEHVFGLLLLAGLIGGIPAAAASLAFRHSPTTAIPFLVGTAAQIIIRSVTALATALLYFDLRSRLRFIGEHRLFEPSMTPSAATPGGPSSEPTGHPFDPSGYTDEDRPHGWYVIPDSPWKMRYWPGDGADGWSRRKAKTPKATLAEWKAGGTAGSGTATGPPTVEPTGHPLDPDSYRDEERPPGWYVIPDTPWKMRYWLGVDGGWSGRTAKTPKQTQAGWYKIKER